MSEKLLVVTPPDDTLLDGLRLLLVDLNEEQTQSVSTALLMSQLNINIISYVWNTTNPVDWLLDKILKSNLIIFNADSENDLIVGYLAANIKSYYFGNLKDLHIANNRAIFAVSDISNLLEKVSKKHEQI